MIKERIKEVIYVSVWEFHTENSQDPELTTICFSLNSRCALFNSFIKLF